MSNMKDIRCKSNIKTDEIKILDKTFYRKVANYWFNVRLVNVNMINTYSLAKKAIFSNIKSRSYETKN